MLISLQTNVCKMIVRGVSFVKDSPLIEISASKEDTYYGFAKRAGAALGLRDSAEESTDCLLVLFRPVIGSIIKNDDITIRDVCKPWTLGNYVTKSHKSSDSLKFGVGFVKVEVALSAGLKVGLALYYICSYTILLHNPSF